MNTFLNALNNNGLVKTENGGLTRTTTDSAVLDMFGMGGAYRKRSEEDIVLLFKEAYEENPSLAMKCLFYLRDVRGGQGERRFFRVAFHWLCLAHPAVALKNLNNVAEFGRWDDLIYAAEKTSCEDAAFTIIKQQFYLDLTSKTPSLLGKWLPSQNAHNEETKRLGYKIANYLHLTPREYRKSLSALREKIKVLEKLMSTGRWDEIEFDKIPSRAGMIYRNAFARRDVLAEKYAAFAKDSTTAVNASVLYPQEVAHKAFSCHLNYDNPNRLMLQKYWENLRDFYNGRQENGIAIVDVSGSMWGTPLEAAVGLGAYIAERGHGPFANHFITFSRFPKLVKFEGVDIVNKMQRCKDADWGMNTDISAVFDLLLKTAKKQSVKPEDMPTRLYIFSDMEFDEAFEETEDELNTDLERIKRKWKMQGYTMPQVIFWNLDARHNHIPAIGDGFSYVSGFSASMIDCILSGKDGYDLMLEKLLSERYRRVVA